MSDHLLNDKEREHLVAQLEKILQELLTRQEPLLRDLPQTLQQKIRSHDVIGPITSSGLEHVSSLIDRLMWLIYYLNNPEYIEIDESIETQPTGDLPTKPASAKTTPRPQIRETSSEESSKSHPPEPEFDFGPFDPRPEK
jgi:hypothetical protein